MKLSAFFMTLLFMLGLTGCNTIEGAGEDMKAAGEAIENSASENKDY